MTSRVRIYFSTILVAACLAGAIFVLERSVPAFQVLNLKGRDLYFQIRHAFSPIPDEANDIVLVTIDDESLKRMEKSWPFPRSIYTEVLNRLKPFAPKVIGFDLIFSGKDLVPSNDLAFSQALKSSGNVVIASHLSSAGEIGPVSMIGENAWQIGIVDKPRDPDQIIRRAAFYFSTAGIVYPSWETSVFNKAFDKSLALGMSQNYVIDYRLKPEDFLRIPFWRLLEGSVLADELRGKIILIGPTAEVFHDIHNSPLGRIPGLVINGNVIAMLIRGYLYSFPQELFLGLINFFSLWVVLLLSLTRSFRKGFWVTCFLSALYLGVGYWAFIHYKLADFWLLIASMFLVLIVGNVIRSTRLTVLETQLKHASVRDNLSGFYTEEFFYLKLNLEMMRFGTGKTEDLSLMLIQIDQLADSAEPDRLISEASQVLHLSVRKNELVCRLEDLFAVILPGTNLDDAGKFGEKIIRSAQQRSSGITFSVAVISRSKYKTSEPNDFVKAAKLLLSEAYFGGGNRVLTGPLSR